jgi:hypothetical protein
VHIDDQTSALASGELQPGERVLWSGKPDSRRWLYPQDAVLVPFSVLWGGFAIFWEATVLLSSGPRNSVILPLWGVPFVLVGLYMMVGRFFARRWVRRRTLYAVTDRRVIAIKPAWRGGRHTSSVWLASHPPVQKRIGRDGRGTVWVGRRTSDQHWLTHDSGWPQSGSSSGEAVAFCDIPEANGIFVLIARQLGDLGQGQVSGS